MVRGPVEAPADDASGSQPTDRAPSAEETDPPAERSSEVPGRFAWKPLAVAAAVILGGLYLLGRLPDAPQPEAPPTQALDLFGNPWGKPW